MPASLPMLDDELRIRTRMAAVASANDQSSGLIDDIAPAAEILHRLVTEAECVLQQAAQLAG